jgi:hypothetical protein
MVARPAIDCLWKTVLPKWKPRPRVAPTQDDLRASLGRAVRPQS